MIGVSRSTFRSELSAFFATSTIHGFVYFSEYNKLSRLLWLAIVASSFALGGLIIRDVWQEWLDNPVLTTIESVSYPVQNLDFPTVTICGDSRLDHGAFEANVLDTFAFKCNEQDESCLNETASIRSDFAYVIDFLEANLVEKLSWSSANDYLSVPDWPHRDVIVYAILDKNNFTRDVNAFEDLQDDFSGLLHAKVTEVYNTEDVFNSLGLEFNGSLRLLNSDLNVTAVEMRRFLFYECAKSSFCRNAREEARKIADQILFVLNLPDLDLGQLFKLALAIRPLVKNSPSSYEAMHGKASNFSRRLLMSVTGNESMSEFPTWAVSCAFSTESRSNLNSNPIVEEAFTKLKQERNVYNELGRLFTPHLDSVFSIMLLSGVNGFNIDSFAILER